MLTIVLMITVTRVVSLRLCVLEIVVVLVCSPAADVVVLFDDAVDEVDDVLVSVDEVLDEIGDMLVSVDEVLDEVEDVLVSVNGDVELVAVGVDETLDNAPESVEDCCVEEVEPADVEVDASEGTG
jgi:hypothetical protein